MVLARCKLYMVQWTLCSEAILINAPQNWGKMAAFLVEKTAVHFALLSSRHSHWNLFKPSFCFLAPPPSLLTLLGL